MLVVIFKNKLSLAISIFFLVTLTLALLYFSGFPGEGYIYDLIGKKPDYVILIEIEEKTLSLIDGQTCIKKFPISSGKPGWPSPIGSWKIIEKGHWGEGFGGHWMGLNVKWGKYGIHGTTKENSIGSAASHGCIRMFNRDAKTLYEMVEVGTPVIITNGLFGPLGTGFRELVPGDRGADVLIVQKKMKRLGYFKGKETGIYENDLKSALYRFQKDNKLPVKHTLTREDYHKMGLVEMD